MGRSRKHLLNVMSRCRVGRIFTCAHSTAHEVDLPSLCIGINVQDGVTVAVHRHTYISGITEEYFTKQHGVIGQTHIVGQYVSGRKRTLIHQEMNVF